MANSSLIFFSITDSGAAAREMAIVSSITFPRSADVVDITSVSQTAHAFASTLKDGDEITVEGFWDNTSTTGFVAVLSDSIGSTRLYVFGPNSNTSSEEKLSGSCIVKSITRGHSSGEMVAVSIVLQLTGGVTVGTF